MAYAGAGYLGADVGLTLTERARQVWLAGQLHAIGLAIEQAQQRGDTAAVTRLREASAPLRREEAALRAKAVQATEANQERAEAGPWGLTKLLGRAGTIVSLVPVAIALGIGGYLLLKRGDR